MSPARMLTRCSSAMLMRTMAEQSVRLVPVIDDDCSLPGSRSILPRSRSPGLDIQIVQPLPCARACASTVPFNPSRRLCWRQRENQSRDIRGKGRGENATPAAGK